MPHPEVGPHEGDQLIGGDDTCMGRQERDRAAHRLEWSAPIAEGPGVDVDEGIAGLIGAGRRGHLRHFARQLLRLHQPLPEHEAVGDARLTPAPEDLALVAIVGRVVFVEDALHPWEIEDRRCFAEAALVGVQDADHGEVGAAQERCGLAGERGGIRLQVREGVAGGSGAGHEAVGLLRGGVEVLEDARTDGCKERRELPGHRELAAQGTGPVAGVTDEVAAEPLEVVAVAHDEGDGAHTILGGKDRAVAALQRASRQGLQGGEVQAPIGWSSARVGAADAAHPAVLVVAPAVDDGLGTERVGNLRAEAGVGGGVGEGAAGDGEITKVAGLPDRLLDQDAAREPPPVALEHLPLVHGARIDEKLQALGSRSLQQRFVHRHAVHDAAK
jgi:hypothetical protein